jgi:two-component system sensor kinase FixL
MSWVTVVWSMIAAACLTLAGINVLIWLKRRASWGNLLFSVSAASTSCVAACELWMMRSSTAAEFGQALRWIHLPAWLMLVSLVGFFRVHLRAGRRWLAWAVCGLRTLSLALSFAIAPSLNYREITGLRHVPFLGESVAVAVGIPNPWILIGQASLLLFGVFSIDAAVALWRRGEKRQALALGGSLGLLVVLATVQSVLVFWGIDRMPITASWFYLPVLLSMSYELSLDMLLAAQLAFELSESEQRIALAAEAGNLGFWSRDIERKSIWATGKWRSFFGFKSSETLELDRIFERIHPDDRERLRQTLANAMAGDGRYDTDFRILHPDGHLRWIAARGGVERAAGGRPVRSYGVSMDITARVQAEADALRQRSELAHLSRVTMLGELSGSMAHELNQPLTAILSNAQAAQRFLARQPADLEEVRGCLTDIVAEDNRAGEIIRRLRVLLRKGEVQQQPVDVNDVAQEVLNLIRSDLVNQGVATRTEFEPSLPVVQGDRVQIQQVLLNLLMNACDAMTGNGPTDRLVVVSTKPIDHERVRVSVADRGAGIPRDKLETVFEPFFTTKSHGLGLGLSVCRSIIAAHGGRLWATSDPDQGATFHFTLPTRKEANG